MPDMKRFALLVMMLAACGNAPSKLDSAGTGDGSANAEAVALLQSIDERLKALETAYEKVTKDAAGGTTDAALTSRLQKVESSLARREEALGFLEMAYQQQKKQQEAQEAQEPDPDAVFAVDVSKAVAAGQVEGPNSAIVTVVEAWDFA
jgi:hypothetical protein